MDARWRAFQESDKRMLVLWTLLAASCLLWPVGSLFASGAIPPYDALADSAASHAAAVCVLSNSVNVATVIVAVVLSITWSCRFWALRFKPASREGDAGSWEADWTAAASRDVFTETSNAVIRIQKLALLLLVSSMLVLLPAQLSVSLASEEYGACRTETAGVDEPASRPDDDSSAGWLRAGVCVCLEVLPYACLLTAAFLMSVPLFLPLRLWSAACLEAVDLCGDVRLQRILRGRFFVCVSNYGTLASLGMHLSWKLGQASNTSALVFSVFTLCVCAYQLGASLWCLGLSRASCWESFTGLWQALPAAAWQLISSLNRAKSANYVTQIGDAKSTLSMSSYRPKGAPAMLEVMSLSSLEGGARMRSKVIMIFLVVVFSFGSSALPHYLTAIIALYRGLLLLLLVLNKDKPVATLEELKGRGIGFGLLVDASDLRRALSLYLEGKTSGRRLRKYKASVFRMEHTVAVSYRWQLEEKAVSGDLALNMSPWQIRTLLETLQTLPVAYVWMDRIGIPQAGQGDDVPATQKTLLARMMAVYTSARYTLCLMSLEAENGRYHQRAWTLQEYCAAKELIVAQEICPCGGRSDCEACHGRVAVAPGEKQPFQALRERQIKRMAECRPLWLYGGQHDTMTVEGAEMVLSDYLNVESLVHCNAQSDKIRSLYPMLSNIPVESHAELHMLIKLIARVVVSDAGLSQNGFSAAVEAENDIMQLQLDNRPEPRSSRRRTSLLLQSRFRSMSSVVTVDGALLPSVTSSRDPISFTDGASAYGPQAARPTSYSELPRRPPGQTVAFDIPEVLPGQPAECPTSQASPAQPLLPQITAQQLDSSRQLTRHTIDQAGPSSRIPAEMRMLEKRVQPKLVRGWSSNQDYMSKCLKASVPVHLAAKSNSCNSAGIAPAIEEDYRRLTAAGCGPSAAAVTTGRMGQRLPQMGPGKPPAPSAFCGDSDDEGLLGASG